MAKRNTKVIGLSVDGVDEHVQWKADIEALPAQRRVSRSSRTRTLTVSKAFDMLPADAYLPDGRTANDSASVRVVFIVSPDKKVQLMMTYPMSVGRNFARFCAHSTRCRRHIRHPSPRRPTGSTGRT